MRIPAIHLCDGKISADQVARNVHSRAEYLRKQKAPAVLLLRAVASVETIYWIFAAIFSGRTVAPIHAGATEGEIERYRKILGATMELPASLDFTEVLSEREEIPDLKGIWAVLFSSGSSGLPKAVALSGQNFQANARAHGAHHRLGAEDIWLLSLPLFHVGGFTILTRALFLGQDLAFTEKGSGEELLYWLESGKVSGLSLVPTVLWRILEREPEPNCQVKVMLLGGAGVNAPLLEKALAAKLPVCVSYGLTESCSQVCAGPADLAANRYAGKLLPGFTVKLAEDGEIWLRGEAIAAGYWSGAGLLPIIDAEGFFHTQDLGHWRDEMGLFVDGRKSELIISGGENIFPQEVESGILQFPLVADVAVVGVPDKEWGEVVAAAVVLREKMSPGLAESELRSWLRQRMNPWKTPKRFLFVEEIPRNPMNKIIRQEVLRLFLS